MPSITEKSLVEQRSKLVNELKDLDKQLGEKHGDAEIQKV